MHRHEHYFSLRAWRGVTKFLALAALLGHGLVQSASSVNQLTAGDIAILGYNGIDNDNFAFLSLVPVDAGVVVKFSTDNNGAPGFLRYTAPAGGIPAGRVVIVNDPKLATASATDGGTILTNGYNFRGGGDRILVEFQNQPLYASETLTGYVPPQGISLANGTMTSHPESRGDMDNIYAARNGRYGGPRTGRRQQILANIQNTNNWSYTYGNNAAAFTFDVAPYNSAFSITSDNILDWTGTVQDGRYWTTPTVGGSLSSAGLVTYVQTDNNDAITQKKCFAQYYTRSSTGSLIAHKLWFSVYFNSNLPAGVPIVSAKLYVQFQGDTGTSGNLKIHVSDNKAVTQWYNGSTTDSIASTPNIAWTATETEYVYDLTAVLNTSDKINNCEILVANQGTTAASVYFDLFRIDVQYQNVAAASVQATEPTDVQENQATLNGTVLGGSPLPTAYIYWGDNDGAAVATAWDQKVDKGIQPVGTFSTLATGLTANKTYYYRCFVSNSLGTAWSDTVTFNAAPPTVSFSTASSSAIEANPLATVTARLSSVSATAVSVSVSSAAGSTASAGTDFTISTPTLNFPAGTLTAVASATILDDDIDEFDETLILQLQNPQNATLGAQSTHTRTIQNDDPPPQISFTNTPYSVQENQPNLTCTVIFRGKSAKTVQTEYATQGGTATSGTDYTATSGTLVWQPGENTSKTITIPVLEDGTTEGNEAFTLRLFNNQNCSISGANPVTATIVDNDYGAPQIQNGAPQNVTATTATLATSLTATGGAPTRVWILWGGQDGGTTRASWQNTIDLGVRSAGTITANISSLANNRTYYFRSMASNATGVAWAPQSTSFLTGPPTVQFAAASSSGSESAGTVNIPLSLSTPAPYSLDVSVRYAFSGTATSPADYTFSSTNVTISSGQTNAAATITIVNDTLDEDAETIILSLSVPQNAVIGPRATHTFTLNDDDPPVSVGIVTPTLSVREDGTNATARVSISQASGRTVRAQYASVDGTARAGADYSAVSGTLTWTPGSTSEKSIILPVIDNASLGVDRSFRLALSTPENCTLSGTATAVVTIVETDYMLPEVSNAGGATAIGWTTATLQGFVTNALPVPIAIIYWGRTNGGNTPSAWTFSTNLSLQYGSFSADVDGLVAGATYYYRCFVSNAVASDWSGTSSSFSTRAPSTASGRNFYVNDSSTNNDLYCTAVGSDSNDGANRATPKATLKAILDTQDLEPGDVVWIDTGYYSQSKLTRTSILSKHSGSASSPVTFRGATGLPGTTFYQQDSTIAVVDLPGASVSNAASYVQLQNLRVTHGKWGISAVYAWKIRIENCSSFSNVASGASYGIYLNNCGNPVVVSNRCFGQAVPPGGTQYGYGLGALYSSNAVIAHNRFNNNTYQGAYIGPTIISGAVISNNVSFKNSKDGLYIDSSGRICDNVCYSNGTAATDDGIEINNPVQVTVERNKAFDNAGIGIYSRSTAKRIFRNNLVYDNRGGSNIRFFEDNDLKLLFENNTVYGTKGVYFTRPRAVTNRNNIIWISGTNNIGITVATVPPQPGYFVSDYNAVFATNDAFIAKWGSSITNSTLAEWRDTMNGSGASNEWHSLSTDPKFVAPQADNFHLQSRDGSFARPMWQLDLADSPCIDAGAPWMAFAREPRYNGLTIDQGAYGNTPEASRTYYRGAFHALTLSAQPPSAGRVDLWPPAPESLYPTNREITVTAVRTNENFAWSNWTGGLTGTQSVQRFRMTAALDAQAVFASTGNVYVITVSSSAGGQVSPSGAVNVNKGADATFSITAEAGSHISDVLVDGQSVGATNSYSFTKVSANHSLHALFISDTMLLQVTTPRGTPTPPAGANRLTTGSSVTCSMAGSPVTQGSTQYVCSGWVGTGSIPASGTGTDTGARTLLADSSITWLWRTNYWLHAAAASHGSIDATDGWRPAQTSLFIRATADSGYEFAGWTGTVSSGVNPLPVTMNQPHSLTATFRSASISATSRGTPITWLTQNGFSGDFELADVSDPDGDKALTWQEYQAGTNPRDLRSVFKVLSLRKFATSNRVVWTGTTNSGVTSQFMLYRSTNLRLKNWTLVTSNLPRSASGTNTWWDTQVPQGSPAFYRPALPNPIK